METFAVLLPIHYVDPMRRATIKEVASAAGVSTAAVSRAFSGGVVAEDTRRKVLDAAHELGYRPSQVARRLVRQRSDMVTLVTGRMADPFDAVFLEALAEALNERQIRLVVAPASRQLDDTGGVFQALEDRSDAVIIAAGTMPLETSDLLVRSGLPVFLAGRVIEAPGIEGVVAENADGGRQAAELFVRTGRERLAYLGLKEPTFSDRERGDGFAATAAEMGRRTEMLRIAGSDDDHVFDTLIGILARRERPDAIFAATDRLAILAIDAIRALGLRVADDVSVIGFNNIATAGSRSYQLTTIDYPATAAVKALLTLLDRRLKEPDAPETNIRIPVNLVLRNTTVKLAL